MGPDHAAERPGDTDTGKPATDGLEAARRCVRRERRRTVDEREAFEAFARRVADAETAAPPQARAGATLVGGGRVGTDAVRRAYRETVMSVPHYAEEYGDELGESVAAEFGPELAAGLDDGVLTERLQHAVVAAARRAYADRDAFLDRLDAEAASLADAAERLEAVHGELAGHQREFAGESYGALEALHRRLGVLAEICDAVAADRQAHLREHRDDLGLPEAVPDLPSYLYGDLEPDYPVLAAVAATADRVTDARRSIARAYGSRIS